MRKKQIRNHGYELPLPTFEPQGDSALLVRFGSRIDPFLNQQVHSLLHEMEKNPPNGYIESIPGYCTLLVRYDSLKTSSPEIENLVKSILFKIKTGFMSKQRIVEVPVLYGGEHGPDLQEVARLHDLDMKDVIRLHCAEIYTVYFIGFLPGFPYLGPLNPSLETPRLETPRLVIKAGSVGIAGLQTGIYPLDSPGGWRIIGWTPLSLFDPGLENPARLSPGDNVRFIPVRDGMIIP
jgi:inhibitor of KinA